MANLWPMIQQRLDTEPPTTFVSATSFRQCVPVALEREAEGTDLQGRGGCHAAAPPGASTSLLPKSSLSGAMRYSQVWRGGGCGGGGGDGDGDGGGSRQIASFPGASGWSLGVWDVVRCCDASIGSRW